MSILNNISFDEVSVIGSFANPYKYKYQGQERQDELGLNWDSFKWRNYDYAIGRFMNVDPLAEETPSWSPYAFCNNNPLFFTDPDGRSASPIFDSKTGAYLGNDSQGFLKGDVLFMNKDKFNSLTNESKGGVIDHDVAQKNSQSIAELKSTEGNMMLFNKATDFIDKTLYKTFYGINPSKELFKGKVETGSAELGIGTPNARPVGTEYGNYHNVGGNIDIITNNFDNRKTLNTAANIFSNFEHEFRGHGGRGGFGSDPEHNAIYKMQITSPNFKFTTGQYRKHLLNSNAE